LSRNTRDNKLSYGENRRSLSHQRMLIKQHFEIEKNSPKPADFEDQGPWYMVLTDGQTDGQTELP